MNLVSQDKVGHIHASIYLHSIFESKIERH